jgi:hypothetical protein
MRLEEWMRIDDEVGDAWLQRELHHFMAVEMNQRDANGRQAKDEPDASLM